MKVGNRIKSLRVEKGFSTDLMAEKIGIKPDGRSGRGFWLD